MNSFPCRLILRRANIVHHTKENFSSSNHRKQIVQDVPTVRGLPFVGTLFSLLSSGGPAQLHKYIDDRHRELGPVFKERIGPVCSIFVSDAEIIGKIYANEGKFPKHVLPESWIVYNKINDNRRGLYFMDGEEWYSCRKLMNRILLKDDFKNEIEKFEKFGFLENYFESWLCTNENTNSVTKLEEKLYILSITFMVYYLVGTPFSEKENIFSFRVRELAAVVRRIFESSVKLSTIPVGLARKLNLRIWKDYVDAVNDSVKLSSELLVDMYKCQDADGILRDMLSLHLSKDLINRLVVDLLIAAGDTTATATQWLLYLLAKNKTVQSKLYEELQIGTSDRLLRNIIKESMRLYPVPPFITRYLPHDVDISPYRLRAGDLVSMSMYSCGRSEEYFPDPHSFNPDRWLRIGNGSKLLAVNNINASLPYSKGSRSCIGRKMSDAQLSIVIKKMVTLFHIDADNTVDIKLNLISVPSEPIQLRLKKRK